MSVKVSILIPTCNQPQYIIECVESALAQDYENIEVIVNDDSSNDETKQLLLKYKEIAKFKYYKTSANIGRVSNYRKLLYEYACGDWVVMLDGDDYYISNDYISVAVSYINKYANLVLVGAGHRIFYEVKNEIVEAILVTEDKVFKGDKIYTNHIAIPQHTTNIYKRSIACDLNFYNHPSNASDAESLYRLCLHGEVAYLKNLPVVWRIHGGNTTFAKEVTTQLKELNFIENVHKYSLSFLNKSVADVWRSKQYYNLSHHILDLAFASRNFKNVLKVCFRFWPYWGTRSVLQVIKRYVQLNKLS